MASKTLLLFFLVTLSIFIDDAQGDWKFWKKNKSTTTTSTTVAPIPQVSPSQKNPNPANVNNAIANAGNPSLAVGVGNTATGIAGGNTAAGANNAGTNVAGVNNAGTPNASPQDRTRPRQPNPGTDVGLDFPNPKPNPAGINTKPRQNYRDWALDLAGAEIGTKGPAPKLPSTGPALTPGHIPQPIPPGNKPVPSTPQVQPAPGLVPARAPSPIPGHKPPVTPTIANPNQTPSTPIQSQKSPGPPVPIPQGGQQPLPVPLPTPPSVPSGGKSWAEVAGGSKTPSPTPAPRPATGGNSLTPGRAGIAGVAGAAAVGAAGAAAIASGEQKKIYSSNPTFSKGNKVTDEDLEKLSEALFIKDSNNAFKHIRINLQKQTSSSSLKDEAPDPLLTVNSAALQIPTIQRVISLYDNYKLDTKTHEYISPAQRNEESLLVDTFLSTNVMSMAMRFLADKGFVRKDYYDYKETLRRLWFDLYSRGEGKIGSAGFEHVFLTEIKLGTEVSGLHNWIYFNAEEVKKRADYLGYIKKVDLGDNAAILKFHAKFNGIDKPVTTMFIGTSPELEMALYTVCFITRVDSSCPVSLGGTKFNIKTHKFRYRSKDLIGSAYPEI